jgi:hypothetical protein
MFGSVVCFRDQDQTPCQPEVCVGTPEASILSSLPPLGSLVGTTRQAASCQMLIWSIWQLADGIELFLGIAGLEQTC